MGIPRWFSATIADELARLYAINLEGCPAGDVFEATVTSWVEDLWAHLQRDDININIDRPRLLEGFRRVRLNCKRWPAPRTFIEHLPTRAEPRRPKRLTGPMTPTERARRLQRIERDRAALGLQPLAELLPEGAPDER